MPCFTSRLSRSRQAFTLVEILVVIIILAALALIALPSLLGQRDKAKDSQTRANITNTYKALKAEYATGELYSTATVTSAIAGEPGIPVVMVTGGAGFAYPSGKIEVSLLNSQTVVVAGKAASGKTYLLAAKEQGPGAGVNRVMEPNKFLSLAQTTNPLFNPRPGLATAAPWTAWAGGAPAPLTVSTDGPGGTLDASIELSTTPALDYMMINANLADPASGNIPPAALSAGGWQPVTPGGSFGATAWMKGVTRGSLAGKFRPWAYYRNAAGDWVTGGDLDPSGIVNAPQLGQWTKVSSVGTVPAGATWAMVWWMWSDLQPGVPHKLRVAGGILGSNATAPSYFDGDSPGASWTGARDNSPSVGYSGVPW